MNYWHLAAAIVVWIGAVALGVTAVSCWKLEQPVGEPWRAYGPICCIFGLLIAGLYVAAGFAML